MRRYESPAENWPPGLFESSPNLFVRLMKIDAPLSIEFHLFRFEIKLRFNHTCRNGRREFKFVEFFQIAICWLSKEKEKESWASFSASHELFFPVRIARTANPLPFIIRGGAAAIGRACVHREYPAATNLFRIGRPSISPASRNRRFQEGSLVLPRRYYASLTTRDPSCLGSFIWLKRPGHYFFERVSRSLLLSRPPLSGFTPDASLYFD